MLAPRKCKSRGQSLSEGRHVYRVVSEVSQSQEFPFYRRYRCSPRCYNECASGLWKQCIPGES